MRQLIPVLVVAAASALSAGPALAANVSIYGHIDIGGLPQPPVLVLPTPVIVQRGPAVVEREPVYLHVPPGHRKHWSKNCYRYNACGERVYFVQDNWYERVYVKEHQRHAHGPDRHERHDERDHRPGPPHHGPDRGPEHGHDRGPHGRR